MSLSDRSKLVVLLGFLLILQAGCSAPVAEDMPVDDGEGMPQWTPPRSGVTGTPADDVTDPVLDGNGLIVLPNPYPVMITDWQRLPAGRTWGAGPAGGFGPDGHYWQYDRCGSASYDGCVGSTVDPILKFDVDTGELLTSFGSGEIVVPHGLHVDREGNIWIADMAANEEGTRGLQVLKYSPEGEILMRLGTAGVPGTGPDHFEEPQVVVVAPNGDIFVSEGHEGAPSGPGRVKKYSAEGEFILEWGRVGNAPGEFRNPHSMAFDSQGRLFVADRSNDRIQIFDQDGNYIDSYYSHGRVSGLTIRDDVLYTTDSTTSWASHPGWLPGVRVGPATEDRVTAFVPPHGHPTRPLGVSGGGIAVDANGTIYLQEGPGAREGLRGTGIGEGGTIIYHAEDISFPGLQGLDLRPR